MLLSIGLLLSIFGMIAGVAGIIKVVFGRSVTRKTGVALIVSGLVSLMIGIVLVHLGRADGDVAVLFGVIGFLTGIAVIVVGLWQAIWGPLGIRNVQAGVGLIAVGLVLVILVSLILTNTWTDRGDTRGYSGRMALDFDPEAIVSKRLGPITFGQLCLIMLLFSNGMSLRSRLGLVRTLGVNLAVVAMLIYVYSIADLLFR